MEHRSLFVVLTVAAVLMAVISFGVFYFSVNSLIVRLSGFATSVGEANVTVETVAAINFTTAHISWGSGRVNDGFTSAGLNSYELGNVTNGNWTLVNRGGLRIENIGNVNVSLNLTATKTAAQMIGGTGPSYSWNVTSVETHSCRNATGGGAVNHGLPLSLHYNPNTTTTEFCRFFQFNDSQDSVRIDFNLTIPSDSLTGSLGDTITATAFAAAY